ncbi:unnamed protein product [Fraxinus pennsylvanica]|uniref:Uncharacterized protein n=1 Tax=Fraxinus pennsylvanica TaxID=56036 RepID=A0AAD2E1L9_9LAMI|nr:unnamed protein product [Fraxinus pennsylvanica]
MATASCSRFGAGVKIVSNGRENRQTASPHDRSSPPSPNWLVDAILHSALTLASGAGKILSSVLLSDSSSSSSSEDVDSASGTSGQDIEVFALDSLKCRMNKEQESQFIARKSIIERLIMQETFSREECDRLINIVNSRVMGYSAIEAGANGLHTDALRDIVGNGTVDLYNEDVVEAKIWFEVQKMQLNAGSDLAHGTCGLNSAVVEPIESEVGPSVDMAKSHMNVHPPWACPSKHTELRTPSTMAMELFKEGTSYSSGNDYLSSKKQDSLSSGSWNIQEELRRVHLKATEDMLCSPSSKIDPSLSMFAPKIGQESSVSEILSAVVGEKMIEPKEPNPIDPSLNLDAGMGTDFGVIAMNWLSGNQRRWNVSDKVNKANRRAAELKQERELKRLKSSINYNGRKEQGKETVNPSTV